MTERRRGVTRRQVIAGFAILFGLLLIFNYASALGAADPVTTRIIFGVGGPSLQPPTALTLVGVGSFWLLAGALSFIPRWVRMGTTMLWISALLIIPALLIWAAADKQINVVSLASVALRLSTPIALGALAGIYAERSGIINIGIEGMMLTGAAFGFAIFAFTDNIWLGVIVAVIAGGVMALLHGALSITFKTDQIISGTVINILAIGVTGYLRRQFFVDGTGGRVTLPQFSLPLLSDIPILGPIFFVGKPIFFTMILMVILTHILLFSTRYGLRMRAVGENPKAAATVGINVKRTRYVNIVISGMLAGLGGAWFSLETVGRFDDGMTAGKGFIALAAMIFGKWMPFGAFGGAALFGFAEALGSNFQIIQVQAFGLPVPVQFLQLLPYLVTMVVLAGLIGRATGPAATGKPYE
ncbi:MAG: ABC transporter permease [Candidatus Viridilinea halotolerans]|uniref:ABC transporter permease n=1 Tax=Candidatus Viridilinea halotolerans TaxID=2491704 RepID=A0A426TQG6_9CHLR|nr:MAG: ABC transporter permease [Candidatus Viridilinea halotolerans]